MKIIKKLIPILILAALLASCGDSAESPQSGASVDLSTMNYTMAYSLLNDMLLSPENYVGQTVTLKGIFDVASGKERDYYLCMFYDQTACCGTGMEFVPEFGMTYPDNLPPVMTDITVTGVFETYKEAGYTYCQLTDATVSW